MSKSEKLPEMAPSEKKPAGTPIKVEVAKPRVETKSLYWCGTLPAEGVVELTVPASEYNEEMDGWVKRTKTTAAKLWKRKDVRIWLGKCRQYQCIDAGLAFVAWTEQVQVDRETGSRATIPHPGSIVALTESEVDSVLKRVTRKVIRDGKIVNLDQGSHPEIDPNDPKTMPYTAELTRHPGDRSVAEFVYMVKVKDNATDYNAADFYNYIPMSMDQFFENPPPMLAKFADKEVTA